MQITNKHWLAGGIGLGIAVVIAFGWTNLAKAPVVTPPAAELSAATSTQPAEQAPGKPVVRARTLVVNPSDTIASWSFKGAYTGNVALTAQAEGEMSRLTGLLGTKEFTDYILYVSIANQYDLLGDGENEFLYLKKALALDSTKTGLAWYNAGQLFTRLGAYATARTAFQGAVAAEPIPQFEQALADFSAAHPAR